MLMMTLILFLEFQSCGRETIERGCNGDGRIQGGIATIPGFGWWPIKAYRPCPGFLESGGNYRRRGQSMDEVAFGNGKRGSSMEGSETRKKGKSRTQSSDNNS
ncbi:Translation initiation factor IF-2 [Bienertia sinuspersici]